MISRNSAVALADFLAAISGFFRRAAFRATPDRFRCRLFGHIAKQTEIPDDHPWGGVYVMTDPSECGRCGGKFSDAAPQIVNWRIREWPAEEKSCADRFAEAGAIDVEAIRKWYSQPKTGETANVE